MLFSLRGNGDISQMSETMEFSTVPNQNGQVSQSECIFNFIKGESYKWHNKHTLSTLVYLDLFKIIWAGGGEK